MKGVNIISSYLRTRWNQARFSNRQVLEAWQEKKAQALLKRVIPRSAFYRALLGSSSIEEWRSLPVVSKTELMEHFDSWNTAGIHLQEAMAIAMAAERSRDFSPMIDSISVGLSSGTSGNRGLFLVNQTEQQEWAGAMMAKVLPDCWKRPERIALFLRANNQLYQTLETKGRVRFQYFDLFLPLQKHLHQLAQYKPTALVGPPSVLRMLADAQQAGALQIQPQKVISVAEVLEPLDAAWIQEVFRQTVHQVYQCTEGFLAATCRLGTLHLNEDIVLIEKEYIDQTLGKFVPIITDFRRTTQPIIRYRLNDILTERKEPCPCGSLFTAIQSIDGRCDDLFYLRAESQDALVPIFPDFIRRAIIMASPDIAEYSVRQVTPDEIEVAIRVPADTPMDVEALVQQGLETLFTQQQCQIPRIQFIPYKIDSGNGQKVRRIRRVFKMESN